MRPPERAPRTLAEELLEEGIPAAVAAELLGFEEKPPQLTATANLVSGCSVSACISGGIVAVQGAPGGIRSRLLERTGGDPPRAAALLLRSGAHVPTYASLRYSRRLARKAACRRGFLGP